MFANVTTEQLLIFMTGAGTVVAFAAMTYSVILLQKKRQAQTQARRRLVVHLMQMQHDRRRVQERIEVTRLEQEKVKAELRRTSERAKQLRAEDLVQKESALAERIASLERKLVELRQLEEEARMFQELLSKTQARRAKFLFREASLPPEELFRLHRLITGVIADLPPQEQRLVMEGLYQPSQKGRSRYIHRVFFGSEDSPDVAPREAPDEK